jgi:hypothetical protein
MISLFVSPGCMRRHIFNCHPPRKRGIQYAAAHRLITGVSGIRDRPVKPCNDTYMDEAGGGHFPPRSLFPIQIFKQPRGRFGFPSAPDARQRPAALGDRAFAGTSHPREIEGAGNAAMPRGTRGSCAKKTAVRTRGSARHRIIRHSPRNGFTVYQRALPGKISSIATVAFGLTACSARLSRTKPPKT